MIYFTYEIGKLCAVFKYYFLFAFSALGAAAFSPYPATVMDTMRASQ